MQQQRYIGALEKEISHGVRGWVIDTLNPDTELEMTISFDNYYSINTLVNLPRGDLGQNRQGQHGFEVKLAEIPKSVLLQPIRLVTAVLTCGSYQCENSPVSFDKIAIARSVCSLIHDDLNNQQ